MATDEPVTCALDNCPGILTCERRGGCARPGGGTRPTETEEVDCEEEGTDDETPYFETCVLCDTPSTCRMFGECDGLQQHIVADPAVLDDPAIPAKTTTGGSSDYYKLPAGATDLQDLIEAQGMDFSLGNIFKACYRFGSKPGVDQLYDIRKIIWFAERIKARLEAGQN